MNERDINRLLAIARDPKAGLPERIKALEELARAGKKELAPRLLELWKRPKPTTPRKPVNWDPDAAERVVDLYVILALFKSGDPSLLPEIGGLVARAGRVLEGPDDELRNAAKVIRAIGRPEVIQQLIALAGEDRPEGVTNAVRTLQLLDLTAPASGGPVSAFPELTMPVSFTIRRLREEMESIARLSKGRVALSNGAKEKIAAQDYERGEVQRTDTTIAEILTQELDALDLTYAVTREGVVISTFPEAAARWQQWWRDHSSTLRL